MKTGARQERDQRRRAAGGLGDLGDVRRVLDLAGEEIAVLQPPRGTPGGHGSDVDCVARRLDPGWPLRLPPDWRLCRWRRYGAGRGCFAVVYGDRRFVALDVVEDEDGLASYGFPTGLALGAGPIAPPGARAAYLSLKRSVQGEPRAEAWDRVRELALLDPAGFRDVLSSAVGRATGADLAEAVATGVPAARLRRRVRRTVLRRRLRRPTALARFLLARPASWLARLPRPNGLYVLIVGPDGAGKSTLAERLVEEFGTLFERSVHSHWRPGLLPAPSRMLARGTLDPGTPHGRVPHGRATSLALLAYYWLDFAVGGLVRWHGTRLRTGLAIAERGWDDLLIDPVRYRLSVPPGVVRALGAVLPRPDVVIVLEAANDVLLARKEELSQAELTRQREAWRLRLTSEPSAVFLDAASRLDEVVDAARESLVAVLERRAVGSLASGWTALPLGRSPRWWIPRDRGAVPALAIHRPMTWRGRLAWRLAGRAARLGALRMLPRGEAPPRSVREILAGAVPERGTFAVARATHPDRFTAAIVSATSGVTGFAKVAVAPSADDALGREARTLSRLGPMLEPPLTAPAVLERRPGLLVTEHLPGTIPRRPERLPDTVLAALGRFFRSRENDAPTGLVHGDFAPWNLIPNDDRWGLVDWEDATAEGMPFHDLLHHLVQSHVLLGRPTLRELLDGALRGRGWVGHAVAVYAEAAGVDPAAAGDALDTYLAVSTADIRRRQPADTRTLARRARLRSALAVARNGGRTGKGRRSSASRPNRSSRHDG